MNSFSFLFQANIKNQDWRFRDAALMSFGAILEGPTAVNMKPIVEQSMPMLIELMYDQSVVVKDTAAWTIGRVCELHPEAAINHVYLKPLLEALVTGLALPILAFLWLPAFRQFATEPDPDDLKLSRPKRKRRIKRSKQRRY